MGERVIEEDPFVSPADVDVDTSGLIGVGANESTDAKKAAATANEMNLTIVCCLSRRTTISFSV